MRRAMLVPACAVALALSACGGDEESTDRDTSAPIPTIPESTPEVEDTETGLDAEPAPVAPEPDPAPPPAPEPSGGAPAPPPSPPDSPENDVPPPKGSPAERFEQFCAGSPGACG